MSPHAAIVPLPDGALDGLEVRTAGEVDLRRDVYLFTDFVRREGLKRAHRSNAIPKAPALKLARLLSWGPEEGLVEQRGCGHWSDEVSHIARALGLVKFDAEGVYAGYSSSERSFPENWIEVEEKVFSAWLAATPLAKERAILDKLVETRKSEFFDRAALFTGERFDTFGCATGPASRMPLPAIRRALLEVLAGLPAGAWLPVTGLIDRVRAVAPDLILSREACRAPLPEWESRARRRAGKSTEEFDERYQNFREYPRGDPYGGKQEQLTAKSPDVFRRVEGRYLQFFLQEIPFLCGFVDLALAPDGAPGGQVTPRLESVRAFRVTDRLSRVLRGDPALDRVSITVLANFDVLVEAPSWPEREIMALSTGCLPIKEDGPTQTWRIDRKKVVDAAAKSPESAPSFKEVLGRLSSRPLPANVASELEGWGGHARKLTVFVDRTLVELRGAAAGPDATAIRSELGTLVEDDRCPGFLLTADGDRTVAVLEQRLRVPRVVQHPANRFGASDGRLAPPAPAAKAPAPEVPARTRAELTPLDMVGYQSPSAELLDALSEALGRAGCRCHLLPGEKLLLVAAADLPRVRPVLKKLESRFEITVGSKPAGGAGA